MIALLDTNVLIRFLTFDNTKKYKNLYEFFESLERGEMRLELKLIVLFQTIFILKSVYLVPKKKIVDSLMDLLKYKGIAVKEKKIVLRALELWREKNIEIVDCYLIACIEKDPQNILYSYDRDFDKFNTNRKEP
ncbi:MAG: type II toxin-antitoxin system VapC family toxin [Desulfobacteraceae bacterium]|nr:PIN domain-containing protein [Desulfobacteraceae bacterium]MBC2753963.1 type II toxin-antitoxin system VapC family toxin [Desulfobacteraceae bacterium]